MTLGRHPSQLLQSISAEGRGDSLHPTPADWPLHEGLPLPAHHCPCLFSTSPLLELTNQPLQGSPAIHLPKYRGSLERVGVVLPISASFSNNILYGGDFRSQSVHTKSPSYYLVLMIFICEGVWI